MSGEVYGFDMHCDDCGTVTSCSHAEANHERPHADDCGVHTAYGRGEEQGR